MYQEKVSKNTVHHETETVSIEIPRNGKIHFKVSQLHGCCGVAVVHNVQFIANVLQYDPRFSKRIKGLYKGFQKYLEKGKTPFHLNRSKVIMTDAVRKDGVVSIYDFCRSFPDKWKSYQPAVHNKKSGNKVIAFEMNRKVLGNKY